MGRPRIGILFFAIECNRWAPPVGEEDFRAEFFHAGDAFGRALEKTGFVRKITDLRDCEIVPLLGAASQAGGPCESGFFKRVTADTMNRLRDAMPLDALYIPGHGAGITTDSDDMDGDYLREIRSIVGPDLPVVILGDLHGNLSDQIVGLTDVMIAFHTNPHVDVEARGADAAVIMDRILNGERFHSRFIRVPLITPQVTLLTAPGQPFGDILADFLPLIGGDIVDISLWPGFALADVPHGGFSIMVTATTQAAADAIAERIAARLWSRRDQFVAQLTSLDRAVELARDAAAGLVPTPIILADIADNPGGGGRSNTSWILERLHREKAKDVVLGLFCDPPLVRAASAAGLGAEIRANFNSAETNMLSTPFTAKARVTAFFDGRFGGALGMAKGYECDLGPSCLLDLDGIRVIVTTKREQILGSDYLEHFGIDPAEVKTLVLKSRGHFRAGFDHLVPPERVFEVDVPGLTPANLAGVPWSRISRPIFPLDPLMTWEPHHR